MKIIIKKQLKMTVFQDFVVFSISDLEMTLIMTVTCRIN